MNGSDLMHWLDQAAQFSEEGVGVTRCFLTQEHRQLIGWMQNFADQQNFEHQLDDSGNFIVRKPSRHPEAKTLIMGSHQDSVRHGGKYDGMLGIGLPLFVLAELPELPFHVEVVAFGDEEGTRFNSTLVGSSALSGRFDFSMLDRTDDDGVSMREAMERFGLNPDIIPSLARDPEQTLGFIEVHIEQGPVLESQNLPIGIVTSLTGIERHTIDIQGKSGHAGTTPMELRNDALVKAAHIVSFVDSLCREHDNLVGVVGKLNVTPNAVNVIPEHVSLTVELRSPQESIRRMARQKLYNALASIEGAASEKVYSQSGIECDASLMKLMEEAIKNSKIDPLYLFSGAGHDGLAMSHLTRSAMLFVRCKDGLSHHPDEAITAEDCSTAMKVVKNVIIKLSQQH